MIDYEQMSDSMNITNDSNCDTPPALDDIFCVAVGQVIDISKLLGFDKDVFLQTLSKCWDIDTERRKQEEKK